ncbi:hypothetical protein AMJ71_04805 [candidate division TA06 bacterium SM1_40]|uniref:Uncharacterized protein n=1 Tax=candidate division TA06 bacterium SM1_40 TaxID=1703773 RepID=A0A0S8JJZ1_UNCT6|nr:MAG: hypothetical protein AMJ71_04805 [candidate division TA06 bacterium SM1_40]
MVLILLTCLLTAPAVCCAQSVFIWKMETESIVDPDGGGSVQQDYAVKRALDELELVYEVGRDLPEDLSPYRVIFVLMGWWC